LIDQTGDLSFREVRLYPVIDCEVICEPTALAADHESCMFSRHGPTPARLAHN